MAKDIAVGEHPPVEPALSTEAVIQATATEKETTIAELKSLISTLEASLVKLNGFTGVGMSTSNKVDHTIKTFKYQLRELGG